MFHTGQSPKILHLKFEQNAMDTRWVGDPDCEGIAGSAEWTVTRLDVAEATAVVEE